VNGYLLVFAAALLWSLIGLFSQGLLDAGVGAIEIAFWRAVLAGGLFAAHAAWRKGLRLKRRRDLGLLTCFGLVGVTLFYTSLVLAIDTGGISLAFILLYSAPVFVAILAWLVLGESMTPRKAALVALAVLGVVLVSQDGGSGITVSATSLFWGLAAGLSYASYYIFGKWLLNRYQPVTVFAYILPLGALGLLPLVSFSAKGALEWLLLALLAVVSTYLAYLVYALGLKRVEASRAVLVATVEPVAAATLAALVFGERFSLWGLVGAGLILLAAVLAALPTRTRSRSAPNS
jgi:drug/metabolite transporter (DMT)-like permease